MCPLAWPPFLPASACFSPCKTLERPFPFRWWNGGGARAGREALESRPPGTPGYPQRSDSDLGWEMRPGTCLPRQRFGSCFAGWDFLRSADGWLDDQ